MLIEILKSKIHQATVTEACLNYKGSITIDRELMDASGLLLHEKVLVTNSNNGERFVTYVIEGKRGNGDICVNGACARKVEVGDRINILSFASMTPEEAANFEPKVIYPSTPINKLI